MGTRPRRNEKKKHHPLGWGSCRVKPEVMGRMAREDKTPSCYYSYYSLFGHMHSLNQASATFTFAIISKCNIYIFGSVLSSCLTLAFVF